MTSFRDNRELTNRRLLHDDAVGLRDISTAHAHLGTCRRRDNLVPRVLWLFGQRVGASRDSGVLEFSYRKISAVKQWKSLQGSQSKNLIFFEFPRVSTGAHPLTKKPEDSGYEIGVATKSTTLVRAICRRLGNSRT